MRASTNDSIGLLLMPLVPTPSIAICSLVYRSVPLERPVQLGTRVVGSVALRFKQITDSHRNLCHERSLRSQKVILGMEYAVPGALGPLWGQIYSQVSKERWGRGGRQKKPRPLLTHDSAGIGLGTGAPLWGVALPRRRLARERARQRRVRVGGRLAGRQDASGGAWVETCAGRGVDRSWRLGSRVTVCGKLARCTSSIDA